jgi:predicted Rossmann fold nucleotide-binding protein DprA/Smf involved in DNA uptake
MNDFTYITALAHLPKWRTERINLLIVDILKKKKLTFTEFFEVEKDTLQKDFGLKQKEIDDILEVKQELPNYAFLVDELLNQGFELIPIYSLDYPKTLKSNLGDAYAPPLLYIKGNKEIFQKEKVAVVGSRNVSQKGIDFTKKITKKLVKQGNVIVSGFAKGVDRVALEVALENEGQSIIVLPQGILTFSSGFKKHYQGIIQGNILVMSTYHPKLPWSVGLAMGRNRYIYFKLS